MALTKNLTNQISRDFYTNLTTNNFDNIKTNIIDKYSKFLQETENKGLITSILRYGIKTNDENIIKSVSGKLKMKRDFFDLMLYYNNKEYSTMLFKNHINIDQVLSEDIDFMIKNNLTFLLPLLDGKFIEVNYPKQDFDESCLRKYKLKNCEKYYTTIIQKIKTSEKLLFENAYDYIIDAYDYIIDAGNVLHSRNGVVNISDLEFVIKSVKNPLIVIHTRHMKNKELKDFIKKYKYIETPYQCNDDLFILLAYLKNNCKIITNDKYSDHTVNDFRFHVMDDTVNYTNNAGTIIFNEIKPYSKCIQVIDSKIYIPTKDGFMIV